MRAYSLFALVCSLAAFSQPGGALAEEPNHRLLGEEPETRALAPRSVATTLGLTASEPTYRLRIVYVIPANRSAQPLAVEKLQHAVLIMQQWFADRMKLAGYSPKTFAYETETEGSLAPLVNVIQVAQPDTYFHGDYGDRWGRVLTEVDRAGFPLWQPGEIFLVVAEMHVQETDGSFRESSVFVGGAGTQFAGVGMVTGETLGKLSEELLTDDRPYGGLVIPELGPYPLLQDISFPWFEGSTVSSTSSSAYGATFHELAHGFGLPHDFRNDANFNGNLMGNGLRGIRGAIFPDRYPSDDTRLSTGSALVLNYSRFFNSEKTFSDNTAPQIVIRSSGTIVRGRCGLTFTASDYDSRLAGALLLRTGNAVADKKLFGRTYTGQLLTYDYNPGVEEEWHLVILDRQGNRSERSIAVTCPAGHNRAPYPFVTVSKWRPQVKEKVRLDAGSSFDPDGSYGQLKVQWDFDGDGQFDTLKSTSKVYYTSYAKPGVYRVVARLTDERGDSVVSMPIGIRVVPRVKLVGIDVLPSNKVNIIDLTVKKGFWVAVVSSDKFDALQTDIQSVRFGPKEAEPTRYDARDVNGDGIADLLLRFSVSQTGFACGDNVVTLTAKTHSGKRITGTDSVKTVGCSE